MDDLLARYRNTKTGKGHELRVEERSGGTMLWFLYWGEYRGVDDHHHMGIAHVSQKDDAYTVGWLRGTEKTPFQTQGYPNLDALFFALDEEIAKR
jgi:hypothetical protein